MCVEPFIIKTYQKEKPLKLMKAGFESDPQHFRQSMRDPSMRDMKRKLTAHAISCGHVKFCCVTMSSILRAKTLKQRASARDESKEVKTHGRKNAQCLIVTVLCLPVTGHHIPYPDYGY